ncbi:MAG: LysM peptidoglycan-binding domain-containing protein [Flavobacteriaceae bacterium]|jgi:LysM repeat protein|nr:LysM peptidoglycan-binding domain-containing protein [Flavobacteriaceae bacterium]
MKKYLFFIFVFSALCTAQQIKHTVAPKETLYGLSKQYNVSIDDIKKLNPQLKDRTPQIGEELILPNSAKKIKPDAASTEPKYLYIKVEPKETLYGLSKKYGTTIEIIKKLNPDMGENGPKIGEVLKIPDNGTAKSTDTHIVEKPKPAAEKISTQVAKTVYSDGLNVALILPFNAKDAKRSSGRNIARQFYSGAKVALDSLSNNGRKLNVKILDSEDETALQAYDFSKTDLIIGPLFRSKIVALADRLSNTKIPIISPYASRDELDKYPNVVIYDTKPQFLADKLVEEMLKSYHDEKIFILKDSDNADIADYFKKIIQEKRKNAEISIITDAGKIEPPQNIVTQEYNKIYAILVSDDTNLTTEFLDKVTAFDSKLIQPISLYYSAKFDSSKYNEKLLNEKLIYSDTQYVNEDGFNEQKTLNAYKKVYCGIPDRYAVSGFDITYDILTRLNTNKILTDSTMKEEHKQLSNKYFFERIKNGAWANKGARVIRFIK